MRFADIPQYTRGAHYRVHQPWDLMVGRPARTLSKEPGGAAGSINGWLDRYVAEGLILEPDFQRGHVWTEAQQRAYVEYRLRGGNMSGTAIFLNDPYWMSSREAPAGAYKDFVMVDGLQRITAARRFMSNELAVFGGHTLKDFEDSIRMADAAFFEVHVNKLPTRAAVLNWYLELNEGGTIHSTEELARVRGLLAAEKEKA
jgi:hypothetical protein